MTEPRSYEERHGRACEVFDRFVPGVERARVFASMERRWGALGTFASDAAGDRWARPQLSRRDRSLLVLPFLAAQARDEGLELHTQVMGHLCLYAGFPKAVDGMRAVRAAERSPR